MHGSAEEILASLEDGSLEIGDLIGHLYGKRELNPTIPIAPNDKHNQSLVENVHPTDYVNPEPKEIYDLVVIGAGVAGLLSVIIGNSLGQKCALIERHYMGGDCLNIGCFPSKALIKSAKVAHELRESSKYGISCSNVSVDFAAVMERVRRLRASIGPHDSVERYNRDFCEDIFLGQASFISDSEIQVDGKTLRFRKAMIASGASPSIPDIKGFSQLPHLTNGNFFNLEDLPPRMLVIGGGPIGMELAQAMQRLGCQVTCVLRGSRIMPKEDEDAAKIVQKQMESDGVVFMLNSTFNEISSSSEGKVTKAPFRKYSLTVECDGKTVVLESEAVLNATGRNPNVLNMGLEAANVEYDLHKGIVVSPTFQTTNPNVYATGDVASAFKFTHAADWMARIAIRNIFLGEYAKESQLLVPWCTYTSPEIAHVGLYEVDLADKGIEFDVYLREMSKVDRCICDGVDTGFVKIFCKKDTPEILGATIVGPNAGDLISEITVCIQNDLKLTDIAGVMHPYPTQAEAIRQAAAGYNAKLRTPSVNSAIELLTKRSRQFN